jgi:multidrug resistance efflux pump
LLVRIDDREYREQLARAESMLAADRATLAQTNVEENNLKRMLELAQSELEIAQREHERVRGLLEQRVSTPREYDEALNALKLARRTAQTFENQLALIPDRRLEKAAGVSLRQAEAALARLNVERCTIAAPFTGRIDRVQVEIGERVAPGTALVSLMDPTLVEIPIELPISQRPSVQTGAACALTLESREDSIWTGRVARIAPAASMTLRTFEVFVEVDNRDQPVALMPGMFVQARIDGRTLENVMAVPRGSIQSDRVYVLKDGTARQRVIEIERRLIDLAIVRGLAPGDMVITSNLDALEEGVPVLLREQTTADAGTALAPAGDDPAGPRTAGRASP